MIDNLIHRFRGRTFGYLLAAAIAGAPLPTRMESQQAMSAKGAVELGRHNLANELLENRAEKEGSVGSAKARVNIGPVDVAPTGWRKTTRGWERADKWEHVVAATNGRRLNAIVRRQIEAELASPLTRAMHHGLAWVRLVDPITLLSLQLCMLGIFVTLVFHRDAKSMEGGLCEPTI